MEIDFQFFILCTLTGDLSSLRLLSWDAVHNWQVDEEDAAWLIMSGDYREAIPAARREDDSDLEGLALALLFLEDKSIVRLPFLKKALSVLRFTQEPYLMLLHFILQGYLQILFDERHPISVREDGETYFLPLVKLWVEVRSETIWETDLREAIERNSEIIEFYLVGWVYYMKRKEFDWAAQILIEGTLKQTNLASGYMGK